MPHWYWEKRELRTTPSQNNGLDYDTEVRYRREGARFIIELGKAMGLSHNTMASGAVYFHRFYMYHTFKDFPRYVVATCCLFLAGKAEETPKKCRNIIEKVQKLISEHHFESFGSDPREEVMVTERVLLQTLKFDLQVDHPYSCLISYAKILKGDQAKLQKMVQMSWTFVNDSLCTMLCLVWEPEVIAIALMYLAAKLSKFEVKDWQSRLPTHKNWWDGFVEDLDVDLIEDICHHVLDLYAQPGDKSANATSPQQQQQQQSAPSSAPGSRKNTPPPLPQGIVAAAGAAAAAPQPPQPKSRPHTPPPPLPPAVPTLPPASGVVPPPPPQQQAALVTYGYAARPPVGVAPPPGAYHHHGHHPPHFNLPPGGGHPPPPPPSGGPGGPPSGQPGGYYQPPPMPPAPHPSGGNGGYHRGHHNRY